MTIKVNLGREERPARWVLDPLTIVLVTFIILGNAGLLAYGQVLRRQVTDCRTRLGQVEEENRRLETQLPVLEQRQRHVAALERQILGIKNLAQDPMRYARLLGLVASAVPDEVWLESLSIEPSKQQVSMKGTVAGPLPLRTLAQLSDRLRSDAHFSRVEIQTANRSKDVFRFSLEARYPGGDQLPQGDTPMKEVKP